MKEKTVKAIEALRFPFFFIVLMWAVHLFKAATGFRLASLGIFPRDVSGLKGIITAPLIHGDWQHLISNTVPLAALTAIIFLFYRRVAVKSFLIIYLLTGLGVWLMARSVYHIGASGIVYGLVSFVFWSSVFRRSFKSIALALVILVMYSGYFLGIVPGEEGISWESHLYGAVAGIIVSWFFKNALEQDEIPRPLLDEEPSDEFLLPRDAFERTRSEREQERSFWRSDRT